jgi:hypothetical protein
MEKFLNRLCAQPDAHECPLLGSPVVSRHDAPRVSRAANAKDFVGIGGEVLAPAVITTGTGKAVHKDAELQVFAGGMAEISFGDVSSRGSGQLASLFNRSLGIQLACLKCAAH